MYGDSSHHLHIREVGVQYLRDNPESFIESNTEHSWNDHLSNMSMQGTWCDALIVQAVAESQHVKGLTQADIESILFTSPPIQASSSPIPRIRIWPIVRHEVQLLINRIYNKILELKTSFGKFF